MKPCGGASSSDKNHQHRHSRHSSSSSSESHSHEEHHSSGPKCTMTASPTTSHPITTPARVCMTLVFGWDKTLNTWAFPVLKCLSSWRLSRWHENMQMHAESSTANEINISKRTICLIRNCIWLTYPNRKLETFQCFQSLQMLKGTLLCSHKTKGY